MEYFIIMQSDTYTHLGTNKGLRLGIKALLLCGYVHVLMH